VEEIKRLYEKLKSIEDEEEREKIWVEIIHKNKVLLKKRMTEINIIMKSELGDLKFLNDKLAKLRETLDKLKNNKKEQT
jgi:hypothetical protein